MMYMYIIMFTSDTENACGKSHLELHKFDLLFMINQNRFKPLIKF